MQKILIVLILIIHSILANSQNVMLNGLVTDSLTNEPIAYAHILSDDGQGTISNQYGLFEFKLVRSKITLVISCIGYERKEIVIRNPGKEQLEIKLNPHITRLAEITITSTPLNPRDIVKKAKQNIINNYNQKPFSREEFIRIKRFDERGNMHQHLETFWEEFLVNGYSLKSAHGIINLKHGRTLVSSAKINDDHIFFYDFNFLKRHDINFYTYPWTNFASYEYKLSDEVFEYEGNDVYVITYRLINPDKAKGGYENAIKVEGKLYIEETAFAFLRIEENVVFKEHSEKEMFERELENNRQKGGIKPERHNIYLSYVLNFRKQGGYYYLVHSNAYQNYFVLDNTSNIFLKESSCANMLVTELNATTPNSGLKSNWLYSKLKEDKAFWESQNVYLDEQDKCLK